MAKERICLEILWSERRFWGGELGGVGLYLSAKWVSIGALLSGLQVVFLPVSAAERKAAGVTDDGKVFLLESLS